MTTDRPVSDWRILRAFAWMRFRVLMNSFERTGARDVIERFSIAAEQIGPIIATALLAPSAAALAGLSGYSGYWLTVSERVVSFDILRILLGGTFAFSIVGPLLMPSIERTSAVRLLLLPIRRRTLYFAQASSAITEPWVLIALPIVFGLPVGLALGGALAAAGIALAAGVLLAVLLVSLSTLSALVLHLIVRDRRRGELAALLFVVIIPALAVMPGMLGGMMDEEGRRGRPIPEWVAQAGHYAAAVVPSDLFSRATRSSAQGDLGSAAVPLAALAGTGLIVHALGLLVFGRLLDSPTSTSPRRRTSDETTWRIRVPGLSKGSAAVAKAQLQLAMRTPRGRSILLSPLLVFVIFALMARQSGRVELGALAVSNGVALAALSSGICLLGILPLAANQFAVDRAGLTLALLSPLTTWELLKGKAAGNGLIAGLSSTACYVLAGTVFRGGNPALWLALPPALIATYVLAAPAFAALSTIFPRAVDLNTIGHKSNAHGAAGFLGLLVVVCSGLPNAAIALLTTVVLRRPWLTPVAIVGWLGVSLAISRILFVLVARLFDSRRENLGLVV